MGCENVFFVRVIWLFKIFQTKKTPFLVARLLGDLLHDLHSRLVNLGSGNFLMTSALAIIIKRVVLLAI